MFSGWIALLVTRFFSQALLMKSFILMRSFIELLLVFHLP